VSDLIVKNPHSVWAALQARPQEVLEICVPARAPREGWEKVLKKAQELQIRCTSGESMGGAGVSRAHPRSGRGAGRPEGKGRERTGDSTDPGRMGAAHARLRPRMGVAIEALFSSQEVQSEGARPQVWLALDCLQDPQNLGSIFRSAAFFGVRGIVMPQERSAPLTGTAYDVASGGVESVPFSVVPNLKQAIEKAKDSGLWVLGTSEHSAQSLRAVQADRPWLVVLGNEERGMRRLTEECCDVQCAIPSRGQVTSLNVSVAAGILMGHLCLS
jgi:23S rRNA (guanosine2251-2'-O)-methyltransferase